MPSASPRSHLQVDALDRARAGRGPRPRGRGPRRLRAGGRLRGGGGDGRPGLGILERLGPPSAISRPTILVISSMRDRSATGYSPTSSPLRSTVIRSEIS